MIFVLLVTAMDFHRFAVMLLFYGAVNGAKQALQSGDDVVTVPENNFDENPAKVMALVIVEDIEKSEETNPSMKYEAPMLPWIENPQIMLPWIESVIPEDNDEDSSGEVNSAEYPDSDTESGTDSESNYYHEDDYLKDKLKDFEKKYLEPLRKNRWKSCQKAQTKQCRKACQVSYKNACREQTCKKKLKKLLKKQCKQNCKEFFQ